MNEPPIRVLLANDVPANLRVLKRLISRRGCHVVLPGDGQEAMERVRESDFDVVLLDIQMPITDGLEACGVIRAFPSCRTLPIIAMSARGTESDQEACRSAGMTECVPKPANIDELFRTIQKLVRYEPPVANPPVRFGKTRETLDDSIFDLEDTMKRTQGDKMILRLFVGQFESNAPALALEKMRAAENRDLDEVARIAHQLRGIAANLGAKRLQSIAATMERAADDGNFELLADLLPQLPLAIGQVHVALESCE